MIKLINSYFFESISEGNTYRGDFFEKIIILKDSLVFENLQ